MELALQIIIGAFCLPLSFLGLRSMFAPKGIGEAMDIAPGGVLGLNTIRGVLGGFFLACVSMLVLGLTTGETTWFLPVAILMAAAIVGRIVGIAADGFDKAVVPPLIVELVIGGVLLAAHVVLGSV